MTLEPSEPPIDAKHLDEQAKTRSVAPVRKKADRNPADLARFLLRLDPKEPNGGKKYKELLSRKAAFFNHNRCLDPDGCATEVVYRAGEKLVTEEIENLESYCGGIARMLLFEVKKEQNRTAYIADLSEEKQDIADPRIDDVARKIDRERLVDCVRQCIAGLNNTDMQSLVVQYYDSYKGEQIKVRSNLAKRFNFSPGALRKRMSDIRDELETCAANCRKFLWHV